MSEQELSIIQIGFIWPIVNSLKDRQELPELLRKSGLSAYELDNKEGYVPAVNVYSFFQAIEDSLGVHDFMHSFTEVIELESLENFWGLVGYAPDLHTAVQLAVKYNSVLISHEQLGLNIEGAKAVFTSCFLDEAHQGKKHIIAMALALMIQRISDRLAR